MAFKAELKTSLAFLTEQAKDRLLAELADPVCQQEWIDAYRHRLRRKEKDAVRLYPELLRMIGPENSVTLMIQNRFGCDSEDQMARIIETYKDAESLTDEQRFDRCMEYAVTYLKKAPERIDEALARLTNSSRAVLVEAEGANGTA